jgi:hypothetical protein
MEDLLDTVPQKKLYKDIAVRAGTFMGGPIVAGYLIAENFKGTEKIPGYIIPFIYTQVASYMVRQYQGD